MRIRVIIPILFIKNFTNGTESVEVQGNTIGDCFEQLVNLFPRIGTLLFNEEKKLRGYIRVSVNGKFLTSQILKHRLSEGDDISFNLNMGGG